MRAVVLSFLLVPAGALADDDGVVTLCQRDGSGRNAPITCSTVDGEAFAAVPAGRRLHVTDVIFENWSGRFGAEAGGKPVWSFPIKALVDGGDAPSVAHAFRTPLAVPAGGNLVTTGNGGEVVITGRLVTVP